MNLGKDIVQRLGYVPTGIMRFHFGKITDVTNVIALAISVDVLPDHLLARHLFNELERFKDRTTVAAAAAEVINLAATWCCDEVLDEAHNISGMNVVSNLLAPVPVDLVRKPVADGARQVGEEAVQLDAAVVRSREAAAA